MSNDEICSSLELKEFAFNSKPTAFNFARWLESKTNDKYTIIEKEFIREALAALDVNAINACVVNDKLKKKWEAVIMMLML
jgi:hypothetical protein